MRHKVLRAVSAVQTSLSDGTLCHSAVRYIQRLVTDTV